MAFKYKPSATERKDFAEKMANDPQFKADYLARKEAKEDKKRSTSRFNYKGAGGYYLPTKEQYNAASWLRKNSTNTDQLVAAEAVVNCYLLEQPVHHDAIHIINEYIRNSKV